jgi:predicted nucleic acid-binding protein
MEGVTIDASVALAWCYPDEQSQYSLEVLESLETSPALVPSLWPLEIANALLVGERRLRLARTDVTRFLELLNALPIEIDDQTAGRALTHTLPLARTHSLSAYDAAYLELSMREGLALATLDQRLRKAARAVGVPLFEQRSR